MVGSETNIAILGVGNLLMKDEGIGVHIVQLLEKNYTFDPEVEIIDGGTSGSELYGFFDKHDKMIIVDAVNFGKEAGFIGTIENDDILSQLNTKLSMHNLGLTDVLSHVKLLDIEPSEICLVGIQPELIEYGMELSKTISDKMNRILEVIFSKLAEWKVTYQLREA